VLVLTSNTPGALGVFARKIFDAFGAELFQATRTRLARPATVMTVTNPERYVGRYAMYGTAYEVTFEAGKLLFRVGATSPGSASAVQYTLIPLEKDVFLMEGAAGVGGTLGDVGFFGDDGRGRATNLVAPVFPAKRVN
jgi:hypothetical protein